MFGILLLILLVVLSILGILLELKKWRTIKRLKNFLPLNDWPIIGFSGAFIGKSEAEAYEYINRSFQDAPKMPVLMWFGPKLIVGISDPDDLKTVLTADECLDKPYIYKQLNINLSLASSPKNIWKHDRRALNPSFSNAMMARFLPVFNEKASYFCEHLKQHCGESDNSFKDLLVGCMANQVINTSFHPDIELTLSEAQNFNTLILTVCSYIKRRILRPWLRWDSIYRLTNDFEKQNIFQEEYSNTLKNLTEKLCNKLAEKREVGVDVLEMGKQNKMLTMVEKCLLLKRDGVFMDENIDDHIRFLFAASIETTSSAIFNIILLLSIHPEYQERVVDELSTIFDAVDTPVTFEELAKMKFTEMVVKEALRFYAIVPIFGRECTKDLPIKNGTIPKNTMVVICAEQIHHDPKHWGPNANEFYPERFLPENISRVHPYSFLPFSAGPRNCLGMKYAMVNIKVYLAHLFRRYKFTTKLKLTDVRFSSHVASYVINERPFQFEPRVFK